MKLRQVAVAYQNYLLGNGTPTEYRKVYDEAKAKLIEASLRGKDGQRVATTRQEANRAASSRLEGLLYKVDQALAKVAKPTITVSPSLKLWNW